MRRLGSLLATLLLATGTVVAHAGEEHAETGTDPLLPLALVGGGVLVLGTSAYLDHADQRDDRLANLGVLLGIVGLLAGITLSLV